jgi:hypothetical protein
MIEKENKNKSTLKRIALYPFKQLKNDAIKLSGKDKIIKLASELKEIILDFKKLIPKKAEYKTYEEALIKLELTKKDECNLIKYHKNMRFAAIAMALITFILCIIFAKDAMHTLSFSMIILMCLFTNLKHSIRLKQIKEQRLLTIRDFLSLVFLNR